MPTPYFLVEMTGFEPAASSSRTKRATKLRYISIFDCFTVGAYSLAVGTNVQTRENVRSTILMGRSCAPTAATHYESARRTALHLDI